MIRKWEWVRNYCTLQGFERSAEIADQIDRVLCYLYGDVDTGEWRDYIEGGVDGIRETGYTELGVVDVRASIVSEGDFCIACEASDDSRSENYPCDECEFGDLVGACGTEGSLFEEFLERWWDESGT